MVYASTVSKKRLTFVVSGQLWNRSLVMMDQETGSMWSHILGVSVEGSLKGKELVAIPADMLTWDGWRKEHPQTTVLNLRRTSKNYRDEFYRDPKRFVIGFTGALGVHHVSFAALKARPVQNLDARGLPLLCVFDPKTTSARLFDRRLGDRLLTFTVADDAAATLRDTTTGSVWTRSGKAIDGPLKGRTLKPHVAIPSYTRAWTSFHPDSKALVAATRD